MNSWLIVYGTSDRNNFNLIMEKVRKYRIVCDSCPLKRKDCKKCQYFGGYDEKVYCHYTDKDWIKLK